MIKTVNEWFKDWKDIPMNKRKQNDLYQIAKGTIEAKMLDGLFKHYPQLKNKIDFVELATPLTYNHYIGTRMGESYGMEFNGKRCDKNNTIRPDTSIEGLYLTGQDILTPGVTGALLSAIVTVNSVLGYGGIVDILSGREFMKELIHLKKLKKKND